ncbi:MAG: hypothetical protein WDM87_02795 [Terracidiphilus sp.]
MTEQPLAPQKEGFWGRFYPFARKKWVKRQIDPINDRLSELDEVNAKNAQDIRDLDARAQAGIRKAQSAADAANQLAMSANTTAENANTAAQNASNHVNQVNTTVNGLDQYKQATDLVIKFRGSSPVLTADSKAALDQLASSLTGHEGYILEMESHSPLRAAKAFKPPSACLRQSSATSYRNIRFPSIACTPWPSAMKLRWPQRNRRSKSKARAGSVQQCARERDGKQFGGPGSSVTPKRSCRSWHRAAVR